MVPTSVRDLVKVSGEKSKWVHREKREHEGNSALSVKKVWIPLTHQSLVIS
jgi:hypothetical protein